jgi:hypothetical protein
MSVTSAWSRRAVPLSAALASLALLAAGCGSSSQSSSSSTDPSFQGFAAAAYRYASCMRSHGLNNFPDPQTTEKPGVRMIREAIPPGLEGTPRFAAAKAACRGILPNPGPNSTTQTAAQQHARELDLLAFARCLRTHGLPNFPDPTSQGQFTLQMVTAAGIDLHAPVVLTAAKACIRTANGAITGADVERAISGTH